MPWAKYAAQPSQDATAKPWEKYGGGHAPSTEPEQPGFLENLGHSLGLTPASSQDALADLKAHPVRKGIEALAGPAGMAAEGLWNGGRRIGGELVKAGKSAMEGNAPGAASHAISALPFVGPALEKMDAEAPPDRPGQSYASRVWADATPGNVGTALGTSAQIAPALLGGLDAAVPERPLVGQIPSTARAAKVFADIEKSAKDVPVNMDAASPAVQGFRDYVRTGGRPSPVVSKLASRMSAVEPKQPNMLRRMESELSGTPASTPPKPILFPEARDFYSNVSEASARPGFLRRAIEPSSMPKQRYQLGGVRDAMNSDLTNALPPELSDQYTNALREYARAKTLGKITKGAALLGAGELARRTGLVGKIIHQGTVGQ